MATVTVTPIHDDAGGVVGSVIAIEDMTEARRAAAEAAESDQRLRLAHAAAELGSWHWNAVDGTNVWDAQLHHIYGLRRAVSTAPGTPGSTPSTPTTCPR